MAGGKALASSRLLSRAVAGAGKTEPRRAAGPPRRPGGGAAGLAVRRALGAPGRKLAGAAVAAARVEAAAAKVRGRGPRVFGGSAAARGVGQVEEKTPELPAVVPAAPPREEKAAARRPAEEVDDGYRGWAAWEPRWQHDQFDGPQTVGSAVFVRGLPPDATPQQIGGLFSASGQVCSVQVDNGPLPTATVGFVRRDAALKAEQRFHATWMQGFQLKVSAKGESSNMGGGEDEDFWRRELEEMGGRTGQAPQRGEARAGVLAAGGRPRIAAAEPGVRLRLAGGEPGARPRAAGGEPRLLPRAAVGEPGGERKVRGRGAAVFTPGTTERPPTPRTAAEQPPAVRPAVALTAAARAAAGRPAAARQGAAWPVAARAAAAVAAAMGSPAAATAAPTRLPAKVRGRGPCMFSPSEQLAGPAPVRKQVAVASASPKTPTKGPMRQAREPRRAAPYAAERPLRREPPPRQQPRRCEEEEEEVSEEEEEEEEEVQEEEEEEEEEELEEEDADEEEEEEIEEDDFEEEQPKRRTVVASFARRPAAPKQVSVRATPRTLPQRTAGNKLVAAAAASRVARRPQAAGMRGRFT